MEDFYPSVSILKINIHMRKNDHASTSCQHFEVFFSAGIKECRLSQCKMYVMNPVKIIKCW